jgi:ABC-type glycerol-3-phosphate transport system substrate-binding protein
VLPLNRLMERDGVALDDVTAATREAVTLGGEVLGLPCVNVSNMLLYRRDLLDRHGLPVPQDWAELRRVGAALQSAVRRDEGRADFHGFATRSAGGGGHSVWTIGSFLASFGGRWLDRDGRATALTPEAEAALGTYLDLLAAAGPPDQPSISFVELMRDYRAGRVGMVLEVGMEYAHLFRDDPGLGARSGVALVPAGPAGRFANLYSPPWAIPRASKAREEAWELARFLTSLGQLLEDGLAAEAVEAAPLPVLHQPGFDGHFRADLLAVARATRAIAAEERPWSTLGIGACEAVGEAVCAALRGEVGTRGALERVQRGLEGLARHG